MFPAMKDQKRSWIGMSSGRATGTFEIKGRSVWGPSPVSGCPHQVLPDSEVEVTGTLWLAAGCPVATQGPSRQGGVTVGTLAPALAQPLSIHSISAGNRSQSECCHEGFRCRTREGEDPVTVLASELRPVWSEMDCSGGGHPGRAVGPPAVALRLGRAGRKQSTERQAQERAESGFTCSRPTPTWGPGLPTGHRTRGRQCAGVATSSVLA